MYRPVLTVLTILVFAWGVAACAPPADNGAESATEMTEMAEEEPMAEMAGEEEMAESYPDPDAETAQEVQDFIQSWVTENAGEGGVYAIPPRGGHEVAGTLASFHAVHQKDADTYHVCVDFDDGTNTYDVDFFVDRSEAGLDLADHFLHKVNGEEVVADEG